MLAEIPSVEYPNSTPSIIGTRYDLLVSLSRAGFLCEPKYIQMGIKGALNGCYARQAVVARLLLAEKKLPQGYRFKIWDAYRPISVQKALWEHYREQVVKENPTFSDEEIDKITNYFVSKPSFDIKNPSVHNSGGAIDLTIVDEQGNELDMGAKFDDFSPMSWSNYYELNDIDDKIKENRRLLYNVMTSSGFTNLPSEFWHYDYGDIFWAYYTGEDAIYHGVLNNNDSHFEKMGL